MKARTNRLQKAHTRVWRPPGPDCMDVHNREVKQHIRNYDSSSYIGIDPGREYH